MPPGLSYRQKTADCDSLGLDFKFDKSLLSGRQRSGFYLNQLWNHGDPCKQPKIKVDFMSEAVLIRFWKPSGENRLKSICISFCGVEALMREAEIMENIL